MGNVLASGKPIAAPIPLNSAIVPAEPAPVIEPLAYPGIMEELHKKCKDVMPSHFEGVKFLLNKGLSNHFQVSHSINLCTSTPSGYKFGATYVGTKQLSPSEAYPVLFGDIDPTGNLNANIIHQVSDSVRCKFASQVQNSKITAAQLTTDYRGQDFSASLTIGNPNIINDSGVFVAHYLQSITQKLAMGGELAYQYGSVVPGGEIAVMSAAARYQSGLSTWSGTVGLAGVHLCYYQRASEQLQLGVEIETNFRLQEAVATVGYQVDLPKCDLVFRGMCDTNWTVVGVLEKKLLPLPFSFTLSALLNHTKNQFRLGAGLIIA